MKPYSAMLVFLLLVACLPSVADPIELVCNGRSPFVIYHDATAPSSVAVAIDK